jgi:hypothetical protein
MFSRRVWCALIACTVVVAGRAILHAVDIGLLDGVVNFQRQWKTGRTAANRRTDMAHRYGPSCNIGPAADDERAVALARAGLCSPGFSAAEHWLLTPAEAADPRDGRRGHNPCPEMIGASCPPRRRELADPLKSHAHVTQTEAAHHCLPPALRDPRPPWRTYGISQY